PRAAQGSGEGKGNQRRRGTSWSGRRSKADRQIRCGNRQGAGSQGKRPDGRLIAVLNARTAHLGIAPGRPGSVSVSCDTTFWSCSRAFLLLFCSVTERR